MKAESAKRIISESLLIAVFGVVGSLLSAYIAKEVSATTVRVEVENLKSNQDASDKRLQKIGDDVNVMKGILQEWQRQESLRRR